MSSEGYMDGVRVKISEKYKPPPRITLPMSYAQRLQLNKQLETIPAYEFVLEQTVVEKMREWRTIRREGAQTLQERLEQDKPEEEVERESKNVLVPTQYTNILTPVPLPSNATNAMLQHMSPLNIAEFEADTSSPFDNMELKSINDLEELAQVLKIENRTQPVPSSYSINIPTTSYVQPTTLNGYYYPDMLRNNSFHATTNCSPQEETRMPYKNVPDIIKTLQTELNNKRVDNMVRKRSEEENTDEEFAQLPKPMQDFSKSISSMGFPLSRVTRVCKLLGNDHKKVVEHLLVMSELLDLGFPEMSVSKALIQCDNDRDKALDILIS